MAWSISENRMEHNLLTHGYRAVNLHFILITGEEGQV